MNTESNDWKSPLEPEDWGALRKQGHAMLDEMFCYLQRASTGRGPVWQPIPPNVRHSIIESLPQAPCALEQTYGLFRDSILPFSVGNTHPGFMGWVHGAGTPVGMLAEMLAAGLNANLGGRDHMPIEVERQVVRWMSQLFEFPDSASGLFVTGSSMANFIGVLVARTWACGKSIRKQGVQQKPGQELVAYASTAAHGCISRAMDMAGLGSANLRLIAQQPDGAVDIQAMRRAIQEDLASGCSPFLIVGTAGTVDVGAIDSMSELADLAAEYNVHFHVDGAFGALCVLAPDLANKVEGIQRADSIAMDFHKWLHVPYDAGFILVRSRERQLAAFAETNQSYLAREQGGMSDGSPWPCDLGPDLSRGFRALKTWMTLKVYGAERLGKSISESCERARYLAQLIESSGELELLAPVNLNIVCFRYRTAEALSESVNSCLLLALQRSGIAAPSSTRISGKYAIRAALFNHRTSRAQLESLVDFVVIQGRELSKVGI